MGDARVFVTADVRLSLRARLRLLVTGRLWVRTVTQAGEPWRVEVSLPSLEQQRETVEALDLPEWRVVEVEHVYGTDRIDS